MKNLDQLKSVRISHFNKRGVDCNMSTFQTNGKIVVRLGFRDFATLERFFSEELIGAPMMSGSVSKIIGTTLLIWDR